MPELVLDSAAVNAPDGISSVTVFMCISLINADNVLHSLKP